MKWDLEQRNKLSDWLTQVGFDGNVVTVDFIDGFARGIASMPNPLKPVYWSRMILFEKANKVTDEQFSYFEQAMEALYAHHLIELNDDKVTFPIKPEYSENKEKIKPIADYARGLLFAFFNDDDQWGTLVEYYPDAELNVEFTPDPLPETLDAIQYIVSVVANCEKAVEDGTDPADLPGIFETFEEESVTLLAQVGKSLRAAVESDPHKNIEFLDASFLRCLPLHKNIHLDRFYQLFDDKTFAAQLQEPNFILGFVTAVTASPETIVFNEWIGLLTKSPNVDIQFSSEQQKDHFYQSLIYWQNYLIEAFNEEYTIHFPEGYEFSFVSGVSQSLKAFAMGFTLGMQWIDDVWVDFIENDEDGEYLFSTTNLFSIQLMNWPKKLIEDKSLPDFFESFESAGGVVKNYRYYISELGMASFEFARTPRQLEPATNPFKNVGRNDPCPCGSGKKFKKCCLH